MTSAPPQTPLQALRRRRYPLSSWPWRSVGYVVTTVLVGVVVAVPLGFLGLPLVGVLIMVAEARVGEYPLNPVLATILLVLGVAIVTAFGPLVALPVARLERWRLRLIHARPVTSGHRVPPPGLWPWIRTRYTEAGTWRELAYLLLLVTVGLPVAVVLGQFILFGMMLLLAPLIVMWETSPIVLGPYEVNEPIDSVGPVLLGVVLLAALLYGVSVVAGLHGLLARALLGGGDAATLRAELVEISRSRARLVDAFEAERRRIERDLHDGAQQRLVALAMQLGLVRMDLPPDSPVATAVADAHEQAKRLLTELREFVHGIHPQVLTDRGLPAALPELADRCVIPVGVTVDLPHRLPTHVETTAYFVVAEALANVAKHSEATHASVVAGRDGDLLVVEVVDDGRGGAEASNGTGLTGLADRVAVMDGRMLLSSPTGGPTRVRVELPCAPTPPLPA